MIERKLEMLGEVLELDKVKSELQDEFVEVLKEPDTMEKVKKMSTINDKLLLILARLRELHTELDEIKRREAGKGDIIE